MDGTDTARHNRGRYSNLKRVLLLLSVAGLQPGLTRSMEGDETNSDESEESETGGWVAQISGPDYVTVGVPCSFTCDAGCPSSSSCTYSMALDGQRAQGRGNVLAFTLTQWVEALTLTCTAEDDKTGLTETKTKKLQVLAGPANISILGSDLMRPSVSHSYSCHAYCRPSCHYTWRVDKGPWIRSQGNVINITPQELDTAKTIICKASNSVSGLFVAAARNITVTSGASEVRIEGPDYVEVGKRSKFTCVADCTPSCRFLWSVDGQSLRGSEIEMTVERPLKSITMKCEAQNTLTRKSTTVSKTVWTSDFNMAPHADQTTALLLCTFFIATVALL
ncbi:uncharacterized protein LOC130108928 [Lampris incognitus]|uniref:uncharacterized protein LOC130108928 n=1 Tax=Lampris incognitus TaxID=2546036 RepID=UPI0024B54BA2|nr:uncharacterized protein LOC130108928 [Lampris incognitus]